MARVVLTTIGSLGDLHPVVAVGLALRARGHQAVIATHALYRARIEAVGLTFAAVRPDFDDYGPLATVLRRAMHPRSGSEYVLRRLVLPYLREAADDLLAACRNADLIVDHALCVHAPLVGERLGIPR